MARDSPTTDLDFSAYPVGLLYPGTAIEQAAAAAQKKSFWMLVIRWYQEVADLGQGCVNHGD